MVRKIVAWLVIVFALVVLLAIVPKLGTFTWRAPIAVVSPLIGLIGAIGLLRGWPYAHHMAGFLPLAISSLIIWNVLSGESAFSAAYLAAVALVLLALVIYDYVKTRTR